jgi:hypothetical protein
LLNGAVEAKQAMIEQDTYKNVLQRAGLAYPRPFLYIDLFSKNKKKMSNKRINTFHVALTDYMLTRPFLGTMRLLESGSCREYRLSHEF